MRRIAKQSLSIILTITLLLVGNSTIFAHSNMLNVEYDDCIPEVTIDGEDETWYWSEWNGQQYHISHEETTIKYFFAEKSQDSSYTWTTDISADLAEQIKIQFANSMKKWNNVFYYSYDENGNRILNKIINIEEGTYSDHNLTIYPSNTISAVANCYFSDVVELPIEVNNKGVFHYHYDDWYINVNVNAIKSNATLLERTGAHEVGHIIGVFDVDQCCSASSSSDHHSEILMGYGLIRETDIQYKDIAGVSIARGFHTDEDHAWMLRTNTDGTQDVICAQCNGVRYDVTLTDGKYEGKDINVYQSCIHHGGTNQEMLLVASDGERYFYKCQYCRYIATYEKDNATQLSSTGTNVNIAMTVPANSEIYYKVIVYDTYAYNLKSSKSLIDISVCDSGLSVINSNLTNASTSDGTEVILEDDNTYYLKIDNNSNFSQTVTIDIVGPHVHSYDYWKYESELEHRSQCGCGATGTETAPHAYLMGSINQTYLTCVDCGYVKYPGLGGFIPVTALIECKVSTNGSYQTPDGTIYLVPDDLEAYEGGTLVFYDKDDLPVVQ